MTKKLLQEVWSGSALNVIPIAKKKKVEIKHNIFFLEE